jgi:hypothetical protein
MPSSVALAGNEEQIRRVQELARQVVGQEPLPPEQPLPAEQPLPPQQPPIDFRRYEEKQRQVEELVNRQRGSWESEAQGT